MVTVWPWLQEASSSWEFDMFRLADQTDRPLSILGFFYFKVSTSAPLRAETPAGLCWSAQSEAGAWLIPVNDSSARVECRVAGPLWDFRDGIFKVPAWH